LRDKVKEKKRERKGEGRNRHLSHYGLERLG